MRSAGNMRYSPSSHTYSVLRPTCFSPAADPYVGEGNTPEQRPRAEQGKICTQRHYGSMALASSTVISSMCGDKDLLFLGRGLEHSASGSRAVPCLYVAALHSLPFMSRLTSCAVCPSSHTCQHRQERGLSRASWLDRGMHGIFGIFCADQVTGNAAIVV